MTPSLFLERRLAAEDRTRLLANVVDRVRAQRATGGASPICVFDLDGTLMDNRPRVVAILHELGETWRDRSPNDAAACARATPDDIGYGLVENLTRLGVEDVALHAEGLGFWKQRFFTDAYQAHDVEVRGARAFAHACHDAGAIVVYLTGRDLPGMALGSFASLRDLGFPIGVVGTELVVKPTFEMPDADFKRMVAPQLDRLGRVIALFDNEPVNVNLFLEAHPECVGVFLDTQYAPDPPPLDARSAVIEHFARQDA